MEISLWYDSDAFVEEFNSMPEAVDQEHQKITRRRSGLDAVCEKSSLAVFDMNLRDLDKDARKTLPPRTRCPDNDDDPFEADFQKKAGAFDTAFGDMRRRDQD